MSDSLRRKPPRWVQPFIAALVRTGEVREAAKWAGIDHTTAYARRKAHPDFATEWDEALEGHRALLARKEQLEIEQLRGEVRRIERDSENGGMDVSPSPAEGRGALKAKRSASERWTQAKERRFFEELMASANVRRAAEAAGVSVQAVYARRSKHGPFRLRWAQAIEQGRAAIEAHLVAQAQRALDPETMDLPDPAPSVSISEGIKIAQMGQGAGGAQRRSTEFDDDEGEAYERRGAEARESILRKLKLLRERRVRDEGWSEDEEHGVAVPPGWIRDPNYAR